MRPSDRLLELAHRYFANLSSYSIRIISYYNSRHVYDWALFKVSHNMS